MSRMNLALTASDVNHLRRLLAYVDLEMGQDPEIMAATIKSISTVVKEASPEGIKRLADSYDRSVAVPKYARAAVKALKLRLLRGDGAIVDVDGVRVVRQLGE